VPSAHARAETIASLPTIADVEVKDATIGQRGGLAYRSGDLALVDYDLAIKLDPNFSDPSTAQLSYTGWAILSTHSPISPRPSASMTQGEARID
jgi:hypothetical protein